MCPDNSERKMRLESEQNKHITYDKNQIQRCTGLEYEPHAIQCTLSSEQRTPEVEALINGSALCK